MDRPDQELTSTIHDSLRVAIVSGRLAPNQRINQDAVARELGVSKTPVREALRWLERDGLVRLEPNRGAFVAEFTDRDLFEIYELRELLEPHAAAIACAVATRADVAELRDLRDRIAGRLVRGSDGGVRAQPRVPPSGSARRARTGC